MESRSFLVYARDGSLIMASVEPDPSEQAIALALRQLDPIVAASARRLRSGSGQYNCHGLVFASRRANVPPVGVDVDVEELLRKDGYVRVGEWDTPQVGDIVAYRLNAEIDHTGFVCRVERVEPAGTVPVVWVWSAWGNLGEYEHRLRACPYEGEPEFWRLA